MRLKWVFIRSRICILIAVYRGKSNRCQESIYIADQINTTITRMGMWMGAWWRVAVENWPFNSHKCKYLAVAVRRRTCFDCFSAAFDYEKWLKSSGWDLRRKRSRGRRSLIGSIRKADEKLVSSLNLDCGSDVESNQLMTFLSAPPILRSAMCVWVALHQLSRITSIFVQRWALQIYNLIKCSLHIVCQFFAANNFFFSVFRVYLPRE